MTKPAQQLANLGLTLPDAPKPVAGYVPSVRAGVLVFVGGQLPFRGHKVHYAR